MNKIMTIDNKIKNGKLQYDINKKAAKISNFLSGKTKAWKRIN